MSKLTFEEIARMGEDEWNNICDSGCLNEAIRGYLILAMRGAGFDRESIANALDSACDVLEEYAAAEARTVWRNF